MGDAARPRNPLRMPGESYPDALARLDGQRRAAEIDRDRLAGRPVPDDVRAAARWLADQPLTLPDHVADHLDVVLAYVLGYTARPRSHG